MASHNPCKSRATGDMISPRPVHSCGTFRTKNAVSLPSAAAQAISSSSGSRSPNSSSSASTTAVASDEPPPNPAPNGTRLSSRISTPSTP